MKRSFITVAIFSFFIAFTFPVYSLSNFSYTGIAFDGSGSIIASATNVTVRIQLIESGTIKYHETHSNVSTDQFGTYTITVGSGTVNSGSLGSVNATKNLRIKATTSNGGTAGVWVVASILKPNVPLTVSNSSAGGGGGNSNGWNLTGNSGTSPGSNFIGTTDNQSFDISIKANNNTKNILRFNNNGSIQHSATGNSRGQWAVDLQAPGISSSYVAAGDYSTVGGGQSNQANGYASVVAAGQTNNASGDWSAVSGGITNIISSTGDYSVIGGGKENSVNSQYSAIAGGYKNKILSNSNYSAIGGGSQNEISSGGGFIGSGSSNSISNEWGAVGSGQQNTVSGSMGFIGSGYNNTAGGNKSVITGGTSNEATGLCSFIGGGGQNKASSEYSSVSGGINNVADGKYAFVGGGYGNKASGNVSVISGGLGAETYIDGQNTFACGYFSTRGDAQASLFLLRNYTYGVNHNWKYLYIQTGLSGASNQELRLKNNTSWAYRVLVVARSNSGATAAWEGEGWIDNDNYGYNISAITTPPSGWQVDIEGNSDGILRIKVRNVQSFGVNIRWVARVETVELTW